ncbi:hypothetical protein [Persephonella atlantica]|nr:hypothetical protein [Persephonella atlantica]
MNEPITAVISAIGFVIIALLIVTFLVKEGYKYYSQQGKKDR